MMGTFGKLQFDNNIVCTTELPWLNNRRKLSCIPTGTYKCSLVQSPKFGKVYQVYDVPNRDNILIHPANFGGSVEAGFVTELEGCIAPSILTGFMKNKNGVMQRVGLSSRPAVGKLMAWANSEPFMIVIQ